MKLTKKTPIPASPHLQAETISWLKSHFPSINRGASYVCDLMPEAVDFTLENEIKGIFSRGELGSIIDIMNGHIFEPASMSGQHILPSLADGFHLDQGMYEGKWEIADSGDFLSRFQSLTHFQKICLEIWVGEFWKNCDNYELNDYLEGLV